MLVSVIIPARNEAANLAATLGSLARNDAVHETLVIDASSTDATAQLAATGGARVISSAHAHRARQMNLGAAFARGDALLFLHADTHVAPVALEKIAAAFGNPRVVGGAFARRYDSPSLFLRATCVLAGMRARAIGWFLGDQAIFVRRGVFEKLGGFRDMALFEDLDFSRRMRREGRVLTLRPPVLSSARRFEKSGPFARTLADFFLTLRYLRGEEPDALAAARARSFRPKPLSTEVRAG